MYKSTTQTKWVVSVVMIGAFMLSACNIQIGNIGQVDGNGTIESRNYEVGNFSQVSIDGIGQVDIVQGERTNLTVTTDQNLFEYLIVDTQGDSLVLSTTPNTGLDPTDGIRYALTVANLNQLSVDGAASVQAGALSAESLHLDLDGAASLDFAALDVASLDVEIDGAGDVTVGGRADRSSVEVNGAGKVDLGKLESKSADVSVNGLATVTVWAADTLDAEINGAGTINYIGSPTVNQSVEGLGTIKSVGGR